MNPIALAHAQRTSPRPSISLLRGDLTACLRPCAFDIVVFNPPYVPTDPDEMERALRERDIAASWAGGERGREVIDRCLEGVRECLVEGGAFYLVLEKANDVEEVRERAEKVGLGESKVVGEVCVGTEKLCVVRFTAVARGR